jgi:crossover junction endodeoxyribonuclease RuvC
VLSADLDTVAPLYAARSIVSPLPATIGIDPGLTGAIALVSAGKLLEVEDLWPCANGNATGKMRSHLDVARLVAVLRDWSRRHDFAQRSVAVFLERVIPMPGMPSTSIATLYEASGAIRGALVALGHDVELVTPHQWKKLFGLKSDKTEARARCALLYPHAPVTRVKDHNRAEAILIAHYGEGVRS